MSLTAELIVRILEAATRLGFDAVAAYLERANKPDATIEDAIAACRAAESKTLKQFKDEA